jgi:hypothetical protein
MDWNEHVAWWLARERVAALHAEMAMLRAAAAARPPNRGLRLSLGVAMIRTGAWLLGDQGRGRDGSVCAVLAGSGPRR